MPADNAALTTPLSFPPMLGDPEWKTSHKVPFRGGIELKTIRHRNLDEPLPYTLLVKGKFWYFRTREFGTVRLRGEYRDAAFMRHYHRLAREHGLTPEIKKADQREVYFVGWDGGPIKIGISGFHNGRLTSLQSGCPYELKIYAVTKGGRLMERAYHKRFAKHHVRGEWYERVPEILAEIERLSA